MKDQKTTITRRGFVKKMSIAATGLSMASCSRNNPIVGSDEPGKIPVGNPATDVQGMNSNKVIAADLLPKRVLGKTGLEVSMLAFGGGSQFKANIDGEWEPLLQRALDLGVNYFDNSCSYGTEYRYGEMLSPIRDDVIIATKFDSRTADGMLIEFEKSLTAMKTDYVDILMIHSIISSDGVSNIEKGVYKEMVKLKEQGAARYIGFSSMSSASTSKMLLDNLDFDVCLLALSPTRYGDYAGLAIPSAIKKNVGVMAMKVMRDVVGVGATPEELIQDVLDQESVTSAIIGHVGQDVLNENAEIVNKYKSSTSIDRRYALEQRLKPLAGPHALCWARDDYVDGQIV